MKEKFWAAILLLTIGGMVGSPAAQAQPPQGVLKQAIHWRISADWFDPASGGFTVSAHLPLFLLHDALVKPMPEGAFTPCLAESFTASADSRVFEFKIRRGVKFHNGDTLTAEDVIFSFWRYKAAQAKFLHGKTEKVEAPNPNLVRFHFKEPFPDFLEYLLPGVTTVGWIVPKKYVEKVGEAGFKRNPVGAGPYKFVEFVPGMKLVGEAFEGYWRKVPAVKRMEFYSISEPATRLAMVKRGEVDAAVLMQGVLYDEVKKDPKLRLLSPMSATHWLVYIASQWDPKSPWSDVRVRKAASLAIDRQTLADIHMPGVGPVGNIALPGDPFGVEIPADPYNPELAKKLLAEAGYPKGFQGGKFYPYQGGFWPYGEQVANYWKAVGISVETVLLDRPAWVAQREGGRMKEGIFIDPSAAPTIGGRLSYQFGSTSYGHYPDMRALWEQYQREVKPGARKEVIGRIQKLVHEKMMWIPLTATNIPTAFGPRVKGNPYGIQPFLWFTGPFEDIQIEN